MEWRPSKWLLGFGLLVLGWGITLFLAEAYAEPVGYGVYSPPGWTLIPWLISLATVALYPEKIRYKILVIAVVSVIWGHLISFEEGVKKEAFTLLDFLKHGWLNALALFGLMWVLALPLVVVGAVWRWFSSRRGRSF